MKHHRLFVFTIAITTIIALTTGVANAQYHSADVDQDSVISLTELLRVIQFFNMGSYHACPGSGTEDGFCPGTGDPTYTLEVNVAGDGWVDINPPVGPYIEGTIVVVTAHPADGSHFTGWMGAAKALWTASPMAVIMDKDKALTAVFEHDTGGEGEGEGAVEGEGEGEGAVEGEGEGEGAVEGEGEGEGAVEGEGEGEGVTVPTITFGCPDAGNRMDVDIQLPVGVELSDLLTGQPTNAIAYVGVAGPDGNWAWNPTTGPTSLDVEAIADISALSTSFDPTSWHQGQHMFRGMLFVVTTTGERFDIDISLWNVIYGHSAQSVVVDDGGGGLIIEFNREDGDC